MKADWIAAGFALAMTREACHCGAARLGGQVSGIRRQRIPASPKARRELACAQFVKIEARSDEARVGLAAQALFPDDPPS
jgi:hypothetical protein